MNKIDLNKKYRTVESKSPVRIICVDRNNSELPVVYLLSNPVNGYELICACSEEGLGYGGVKILEEVPSVDWSKVAIDTPVWVKYLEGGSVFKRHFFRYNEYGHGTVEVFDDGRTSHTTEPGEYQSVVEAYLEDPNV